MANITTTIKTLKPGELPEGAVKDPTTGKIYYPGGIVSTASPQEQLAKIQEELNKIRGESLKIQETAQQQFGTTPTISLEDLKETTPLLPITSPPPDDFSKSVSTISAGATGLQSTSQMMADYFKGLQEQRQEAQETQKGFFQGIKDWMTSRPSMAQTLEEERERWGIPANLQQIQSLITETDSLNQKLINLEAEEQRQIMEAETRPGRTIAVAASEKDRIKREHALEKSTLSAQIGAKAALVQALQGNISMANSLISQTISVLTYDEQQKRADMEFFFDYYQDEIKSLDAKEQRAFELILQESRLNEEIAREDWKMKLDYFVDAGTKGIVLGTLDDLKKMSVEEVAAKYSQEVAAIVPEVEWELREVGGQLYRVDPKTGRSELVVGAPGKGGIFTQTQLNKGAATAGVSLDDFLRMDNDTKNFFINNASQINGIKKDIDQAVEDEENPTEIERQISEFDIPEEVKNTLIKYLWSVFERPKAPKAVQPSIFGKVKDWWQRIWD